MCIRTLAKRCLKTEFVLLKATSSCRGTFEFLLQSMGDQCSSREPGYDYSINHGSYSAGVLCVVSKWDVPVVFFC